jgi:hypothetical protein
MELKIKVSDHTQLQQLVVLIDVVRLSTHKEDLMQWAAKSNGQYIVKSCSKLINNAKFPGKFIFTSLLNIYKTIDEEFWMNNI